MGDVVFVAIVIAFFSIAVAYVRGCARIVGDEDVVRVEPGGVDASDGEEVAA